MTSNILESDINARVSLEPLLDFWDKELAPKCEHMKNMLHEVQTKLNDTPSLRGEIDDISVFDDHEDIIKPLMSAVFPLATFEKEIAGALTPFSLEPFFVSPRFQQIFIDNDNFIKSVIEKNPRAEIEKKRLKIYLLILERFYGISCRKIETLDIRMLPDSETGLSRYFGITSDCQFVRIRPLSPPPELTEADENRIQNNLTDIDVLSDYIDLSQFELSGFVLVRAMDVTESQVISALERDLIEQDSIFSTTGISLLEKRLKTLFRMPNLALGIGALRNDCMMIIKNDCPSTVNCLFTNSKHICLKELEGSMWTRAAQADHVVRIGDLAQKKDILPIEETALASGIRSILIAPLTYQGEPIGILEVFTSVPNEMGHMEVLLLEQVAPIFSSALKRGMDEMDKHVQSIIKEKCTAVHPSVEWRFEQAAINHMDQIKQGRSDSDMESIIFKDVVPFYGQSDIRGSSLARNKGIQLDLNRQLTLALDIMEAAEKQRSWPILQEYKYRIQTLLTRILKGVTSGDENAVYTLLNKEISSTFDTLRTLDTHTARKIKDYETALDPAAGMVYDKRKDYEESVSKLNQTLSAFLETEDGLVQKNFPHYFEKRQTDGVDYMMYIGASMNQNGKLAPFHLHDMTLWQIMMACGMAWQTEQLKPSLKVPLDTCHLILINQSPLSIRFRFDEKRFDVDGAYDARQEIIKSRLDKALVKGTGERLTQPGRIALVYSTPAEGRQIRRHIEFLTTTGQLQNDMELLDLEDMPDVSGLKALRVGVDLTAAHAGNIIEMKTG